MDSFLKKTGKKSFQAFEVLEVPMILLAGPVSHTSTQYKDFVEIFNISLDFSTIFLLTLVGIELPLCIGVTLSLS